MVIGAGGPVFLGKPFMAAMANPTQEPLWKMKPAEVSATPTVSTAMLQAAAGCCRLLQAAGGSGWVVASCYNGSTDWWWARGTQDFVPGWQQAAGGLKGTRGPCVRSCQVPTL